MSREWLQGVYDDLQIQRKQFMKQLQDVKFGLRREFFYFDDELTIELELNLKSLEQKIAEYENEI